MYADTITGSIKKAVSESSRRRKIQVEFNKRNGITPRTIQKAIKQGIEDIQNAENFVEALTGENKDEYQLKKYISELEYEMETAARNLQFEKAAQIRDELLRFKGHPILQSRDTLSAKAEGVPKRKKNANTGN
jgi:excinuclease ABC subunit B